VKVHPPGASSHFAREPHIGELFIDRETEAAAFKASLAIFRRLLDSGEQAGAGRFNVLTYCGLGGIGKTALSERLEAWVKDNLPLDAGWGPRPATGVAATARIDLHGSSGQVDIVGVLLATRAAVSHYRRHWPVFDLAFGAYWSAAFPGLAPPRLPQGDRYGDVIAETVGEVIADIGSAIDVPLASPAAVGVWGIRRLVAKVRRSRDLKLAINAFDGFERFLVRCADEPTATDTEPALACEIASLLSWELSQTAPTPLFVVFVDTTERLSSDPRRTSESHLNRLIYGMPNVLFVLTGRDVIDWHDESRVELPYRGGWVWPGLTPGAIHEPRRHLVGNLSPTDARKLMLEVRRRMDLPLSDSVIDRLVSASAGLPQYLELARQVAISIKASGRGQSVNVEDVTGSLGSLVMRVLDDVPADEQRAIRAACLFKIFDSKLIAETANVDYGCAERALARPMIDRFSHDLFPYRMHDAVRAAIRRSDHKVSGGWSESDWQAASSRAAATVRRLHDHAKAKGDQPAVLDALGLAILLVCEQETNLEGSQNPSYRDWLSHAIVYAPSLQGLRSRIPGLSTTEYGRHVISFITAKSVETPVGERLALLRSIFQSDHPLKLPAGRHLGYALRLQHRWEDAMAVFEEVIAIAPSDLNRGQVSHTLSLARRFVEAEEAARNLPASVTLKRSAEYHHGKPERYFDEIHAKLQKLHDAGRQREYIENVGILLVRRILLRGEVTVDEVLSFRDDAESSGHLVSIRDALLAVVLHRGVETTERASHLKLLRSMDKSSSGSGDIGYRYALGEFCDARIEGSDERLNTLREEANALPFRVRSWIPIDCFMAVTRRPLSDMETQWLEPREVVMSRWRGHLNRYLARHVAK
jgi:hypothetical protein